MNRIWVDVLIPSFNTNEDYIKECIRSIITQEGDFGIHLVWVDDGSTMEHQMKVMEGIQQVVKYRPYTTFTFLRQEKNQGIVKCLNDGLMYCKNELIFRMDSDDIMLPSRMTKQIEYMNNHPECMLLGTNMVSFFVETNVICHPTSHPEVYTWEQFKVEKPKWMMNHPTLCFRNQVIKDVGGYDEGEFQFSAMEDYEFELRCLKKYGMIHNVTDILLVYRIHPQQICQQTKYINKEEIKNKLIHSFLL